MRGPRSGVAGLFLVLATGCGSTANDQPATGDPGKLAVAIASGGGFSCAVMRDHTVRCWGSNVYGQLGDGSNTSSPTPVRVRELGDAVAVSAGAAFACARRSDGSVWCWGSGESGALGNGATNASSVPVQVQGLANVRHLAGGADHSCALVSPTGEAFCWGANNVAQLGTGNLKDSSSASEVVLVLGGESISAGALHSCAIAKGAIYCWGAGPNGSDSKVYMTPTPMTDGTGFSELAPGGGSHTCGIRTDGQLACWGMNEIGQLGTSSPSYATTPVVVPGLSDVTAVSVGSTTGANISIVQPTSTCAVLGDGTLECWGSNKSGQLGDGTTADRSSPAPVALKKVVGVSVGALDFVDQSAHACAVTEAGAVYCWGANFAGQLGDGTTAARATPGVVAF